MEDKIVTGSSSTAEVVPPTPTPTLPKPMPTFLGNSNDVLAIVAATVAGVTAFVCMTLNYGVYCLPLVAVVLGGIAVANAKTSINPDRTRRWGWVSVGAGGLFLLLILALIACIVIIYAVAIAAAVQSTPTRR